MQTLSESFPFLLNGAQRYLVESLGRYYGFSVTSVPHKGSELSFLVEIQGEKAKMFLPNQALSSILASSDKLTSPNSKCLLFTHLRRGSHQPLESLFGHYLASFKGQFTAHILDDNTAFLEAITTNIGRGIRHQLQASRVHHVLEYFDIAAAPQTVGTSSSLSSVSSSSSSFTSLSSMPMKKTSFSSWSPAGEEKEKDQKVQEGSSAVVDKGKEKEGEEVKKEEEKKVEEPKEEEKQGGGAAGEGEVVDDWNSLE